MSFPGIITARARTIIFVLRGQLTIETRSPDHRHRLSIGERFKIPPGTAHRISNESTSECQFLLVQGETGRPGRETDCVAGHVGLEVRRETGKE
jgi:quercetin dioxygenase-like cupin family protein